MTELTEQLSQQKEEFDAELASKQEELTKATEDLAGAQKAEKDLKIKVDAALTERNMLTKEIKSKEKEN